MNNFISCLGCDGDVALSSVECYHPATDKWTYVQPMACGRHAFGLVELDGWLYASGGSDFSRSEYNSLERYDPVRLMLIDRFWKEILSHQLDYYDISIAQC